jgi:hypothetical protein
MRKVSNVACVWAAAVAAVVAQETVPAPAAPRDVFGPGWSWELRPTLLQDGFDPTGQDKPKVWHQYGQTAWAPSGHVALVLTAAGHPVLTHVLVKVSRDRGTAATDYRAVLFGADGKAVFPTMTMGATRGDVGEQRYVFPPQKEPAAIARFALGRLDLAGKRERAKEGMERAARLGASVLPLPLVGEPFAFDLPTIDGGRFRSQDHLGKVIVIDSWATW